MFVSALLFPPPSASSNDSTQPGTALRQGAASSVVPAVDTQEVERWERRKVRAKLARHPTVLPLHPFKIKWGKRGRCVFKTKKCVRPDYCS